MDPGLGPPRVPSRRLAPGEGAQRPGEAAGDASPPPPPPRGSRGGWGWVVVVASFSSSDRNGVNGSECRGSRGVWELEGKQRPRKERRGLTGEKGGIRGRKGGVSGGARRPHPDPSFPSPRSVRAAGAVP